MAEETQAQEQPGDEGFKPITSQEALDAIVKERVARERRKYADYDELKAKAEQYDKAAEADKSELEKATARAERAEARARAYEAERARAEAVAEVARETGVDPDVLALTRGDTAEELAANAERISASMGRRRAYPDAQDKGTRPGGSGMSAEDILKVRDPARRVELISRNLDKFPTN